MKTRIDLAMLLVLAIASPPGVAGPLADTPLTLGQSADSNVLLNLSVEWPTAETAAYTDTTTTPGCPGQITVSNLSSGGSALGNVSVGVCYFPATTYVGYFDSAKCYTYSGTTGSSTSAPSGYFVPAAAALADHSCTGQAGRWSGNFLNWASMTTIDEFRMAMAGGNRDVDGAAAEPRTILRRSMKYRGPNDYVFVVKRIGTGPAQPASVPAVAPSTVTPINAAAVLVGNTADQIRFSTGNDINTYRSFQVRVQVCVPGKLEGNCTLYAGTSSSGAVYKPTGLIQNNATHMRFAATGYINESTYPPHFGGVLRSRMKYTGPTKNVPGSGSAANPNAEWDPATGVFVANPDSADASASSVANSGVINYLNKFGYLQNYKSYDTLSELYYEGLRYYKHLGPTPEAYSGLTTANYDGFPIITSWDDPIQLSCQQNFIIAIGDSNCWCDARLPGTAIRSGGCPGHTGDPSNADTSINVANWTNKLGNLEGVGNIGNSARSSRNDTYYIAGLAYQAHVTDIRPDDASQPQTLGKQTITTYMIDVQEPGSWYGTSSQYWLAAKYGGFSDINGDGIPAGVTTWSRDGVNPSNYFGANRPDLLISGLNSVFFEIASSTGSAASLGANGPSVNGAYRVFQSQYSTSDWSGRVRAYQVDSSGNIASTADWDTADAMSSQFGAGKWSSRVIYTYGNAGGGTGGRQFAWNTLDATQQAALNTNSTGTIDGFGQQRVNWFLGDSSNEGSQGAGFRSRKVLLGDVVDSSPVYVGQPAANYNGASNAGYPDGTWTAFANANASRKPVVYVGANDGMLHGFDASNGNEVMAYVPNTLFPNLSRLTAPAYQHKFFVDATPAIGDAQIAGNWRTVLIGSLRAGGQGIFALDVTDPSQYTSGNAGKVVLWEFSAANDPDLGFTFSDATIVKTNIKDGSGNYRWAAVIGNGYNNASANAISSNSGTAALFVLFLDGGRNGTWVAGQDYVKIATTSTGTASPNGMGTPSVTDEDGNGTADFVYAGDLNGNLWKFDLRSTSTSGWKSFYDASPGVATKPLYVAKDASGNRQPISTAPEVVAHPKGGNLVLFGTGKMLETADLTASGTQTIYGVWDRNTTPVNTASTDGRAILQQQTAISTAASGGTTYLLTSANGVNWATQMGWYLDLPYSANGGERLIWSPVIDAGRLSFNTFQPTNTPCQSGGVTRLYELDALTGSRPTLSPFDVNNDGVFNASDGFAVGGSNVPPSAIVIQGPQPPPRFADLGATVCKAQPCERAMLSNLNGVTLSKDIRRGRLSWREIGRY